MLRTILTALSVFLSFASIAQLSLGAKAGANISRLDILNDPSGLQASLDYNYKTSFLAGATISYPIAGRVALGSDLLYVRKGFTISGQQEQNVALNYINLPVLFKLRLASSLNVELGPEAGYLLDGPAFWDKRTDLGFVIGLAHQFEQLEVSARLSHGLSDVQEIQLVDQNGTPSGRVQFQNRSIQFAFTYYFLHSAKG